MISPVAYLRNFTARFERKAKRGPTTAKGLSALRRDNSLQDWRFPGDSGTVLEIWGQKLYKWDGLAENGTVQEKRGHRCEDGDISGDQGTVLLEMGRAWRFGDEISVAAVTRERPGRTPCTGLGKGRLALEERNEIGCEDRHHDP
jgi:hypothetical protein